MTTWLDRLPPAARMALWLGVVAVVAVGSWWMLRPTSEVREARVDSTTTTTEAEAEDDTEGTDETGETPEDGLEPAEPADPESDPDTPDEDEAAGRRLGIPGSFRSMSGDFDGSEPDDVTGDTYGPIPSADGCLDGYSGACIPAPPPVLTCADITERNILVTGSDPHGLDHDFDGMACPSELPSATTLPGTPPDPFD